jgi:hypothetical protein
MFASGAVGAIAGVLLAGFVFIAWLGSALTTVHLFREAEAAALLGIPENVVQVALLPVAYTKGTDFRRAKRPPVSSVTHWNRW